LAQAEWLRKLLDLPGRIGASPTESEDERVRRLIWATTLVSAVPVTTGIAIGILASGYPIAAAILLGGVIFWCGQMALFGRLRRGLNSVALASQVSCVLVSFAAVVSLGGPTRSGGLVLLGLIGPFYALVFPRPRRAVGLFVAYLASVLFSAVLGDRMPWARPFSPPVNLWLFAVMLVGVSVFVFATLVFFVRERDRAFGLLREAQERISRLLESAPAASETIPQWSRALAEEIARGIGAAAIGIWEIDEDSLAPVSDCGLRPPSLDELKRLRSPAGRSFGGNEERTLVPVAGTSGELCGVVVVSARDMTWGETERRLVAGFAHQLGAALDLARTRRQLAEAEQRRAATRREMHSRGIATLQVCPRCERCYDHTVAACAADGARLESPRTLPYRLLDRYRFLRVLGQGGMGTVLAAEDERLGREVAVKLIRPEQFNDPAAKERFGREARTVARIQHPGVIALHDSGEVEDGTAFLVMERLVGHDLGWLLRNSGRGMPRQVATLVRQGSAALGAAHRAGVVHRDVKPENIFLEEDPVGFRMKILDFGLAKSMVLEKGLTQTGAMVGTPTYMSPEQVRGEDVDLRCDVYSFAAVCYEALTGVKAVSGSDLGRVLIDVLSAVPSPVSRLVAGVPPEVDSAFVAALAKDRTLRPKEIERWGSSLADLLDEVAADPATAGWFAAPGTPARGAGRQSSGEITVAR
jgi:tRNA A-37 threonylcarbamoyl transferase component Bud32